MIAVLLTTFPFFALVLCGYLAVRVRLLPLLAIPGLNMFVLYFALPCLLYRFGANTAIAQLLNPFVAALWMTCAALMVAIAIFATRARVGWNDAAFGALVAAFPNTGFLGVPLLVALLGAPAAGTAILTILLDLLFTTSLCVALSRLGTADTHGAAVATRKALRGVATNPLPWAIVLGAVASAMRWQLVSPVMQTVALLADAASPVALFTIGAVLSRSGRANRADGRVTPRALYLPVAAIKLPLHPALVFALAAAARWLGAPLSQGQLIALTLAAALPSASNVSLLAERYGADNGRIARIILVSTALSFLTFSAAVSLLIGR